MTFIRHCQLKHDSTKSNNLFGDFSSRPAITFEVFAAVGRAPISEVEDLSQFIYITTYILYVKMH